MGQAFSWIVAVFFGLAGLGAIIGQQREFGFVCIGIAALACPPVWEAVKAKWVAVPVWVRWVAAILLFAAGSRVLPHSDQLKAAAPASAPAAQQARIETARDTSPWHYEETSDPMHDAKTSLACTTSTNDAQLTFPYHNVAADLCLRKAPGNGFDAYVQLQGKGQILCGVENCLVHFRFDKGPVRAFAATRASDNSSNIIFVQRPQVLVDALRKSSVAVVELTFYQNGDQDLTFDTAKLVWK